MVRTTLMSALVFAGVIGPVSAETITVCAKGCDYTSINAAIAVASDGDVIQLAAETYSEGEPVDTQGKAITIQGVVDKKGRPTSILDGQNSQVARCENDEDGQTRFQDLVIRNGDAIRGGGLYCFYANPTLANVVFESCTADRGGGAYFYGASTGDFFITGCTFSSNSVSGNGGEGGGLYLFGTGGSVTHCLFQGNAAIVKGGGLYAEYGPAVISQCTFTDNDGGSGGGAWVTGTTQAAECGFIGNRGGGLAGTDFTCTDSEFRSNSAYSGSAVSLGPRAVINRCTISDNDAAFTYGAVEVGGEGASITSTLFENNTGGAIRAWGAGKNLLVDDCTFLGNLPQAIECNGCDRLQVLGSTFLSNGDGIRADNLPGTMTVTGCEFRLNLGAISSPRQVNVSDSIFTENEGLLFGSGPFLVADSLACNNGADGDLEWLDDWYGDRIRDFGGNYVSCHCPDQCQADLDCDHRVGSADLGLLIARWATTDRVCDLDGDGDVNAADLGLLVASWGPCR